MITNFKNFVFKILLHLKNKNVLVLFFLGFSSGLPLLLVFTTLTAWLRDEGVVRTTIGFFGWVTLFYGLKFLWSPLIDRLNLPFLFNLFGKRRSWLFLSQFIILIMLFVLSILTPGDESLLFFACITLVIAFFSATQDIVVDAYRIEIMEDKYQGLLTASYQFGYRVALLVSGAGSLFIADLYSWSIAYQTMSILMLIGLTTTFLCQEPENYVQKNPHNQNIFILSFVEPLRDFFSRYKEAYIIILFICFFRLSDLSMAVMANPFYLDIGFTLSEIATVTKIFGVAMTLLGAFLGGFIVFNYGVIRPLFAGAILISTTTLMFAILSVLGNNMIVFVLTIALDNITGGFAGTVFIVFLSKMVNKNFTATQYALFSSLMLLPGKFMSGFSGWLVDYYDSYTNLFLISAILGIPSILISYYFLKKKFMAE